MHYDAPVDHSSAAVVTPREKYKLVMRNTMSTFLTLNKEAKKEEKDGQLKLFSGRRSQKSGMVKTTGAQAQRTRTSEETTRLTVTLAHSTVEAIELLANEMSLSKSAVINYLVGKGLVVEAVQSEGGVVQFLMPNGEVLGLRDFGKGGRTPREVFGRIASMNGEP